MCIRDSYLISYVVDRKSYYERMKERLLKALPDWPVKAEAEPAGVRPNPSE